ncbi:MAG TPA: Rieske 2Fe-2S domain-containing protein [Flexilinea sp.]|nr:Rieske 2Fe-2S domain-containing protein [Flexilinea sp.]HPJ65421.1 Rieske 2Fe-2S domain-containing protein [Flexilinea sp.]HPR71830.1 Rieske 2Fe-2S domain-containing protein [Flexilinea sp.]
MSESFFQAIRTSEIAPGGIRAIEINGRQLIICNAGGKFYALSGRCGHMNAPLERGTLDGTILTCPLHCAQFDIRNGEVLSGPVPMNFTSEGEISSPQTRYLGKVAELTERIHTESIATFGVKVEDGWILVAL